MSKSTWNCGENVKIDILSLVNVENLVPDKCQKCQIWHEIVLKITILTLLPSKSGENASYSS